VGRLGTAGETFRIPAFLDGLSIEPGLWKKVGQGARQPLKIGHLLESFSILAGKSIMAFVEASWLGPTPTRGPPIRYTFIPHR
jgi:hypothetical protein